jgi:hypothetical protein
VHHLWLQFLHWIGLDSASGTAYLFWSGFAGDITLVLAVLAAPWIQWKRHNCQVRHCCRFGRHPFTDPDDRVTRQMCWKHHPDVKAKQLTVRHLREQHHLYAGKKPGRG